ncbi:DUF3709 domain-containing protein, partial [Vibrio cholerae]|nr:DUF3709 domain-containing protein [Vibrio cholerae]
RCLMKRQCICRCKF